MSPNDIEILIHYWSTPGDHERLDAPAVDQAITDFLNRGILIESDNENQAYEANREALEVYIKAICAVPLPHREWVIKEEPIDSL